ncbi:sugar-binding transcriptional regulator [Alkaliphilus hydrothermalis]|uniref:Central glycolytic genes regulator n=1 Tax=Alkaliphilus hydrothermalis TaxID=1482730 RepID=A0ABS2NN35_9FIRM|nr:sugar-binding domain-containing protein [Alkaliphilus hydrothermalis]MBM7614363.1 central glycolytic genes regulator [Alkaliphilus hydrothermalis]
MKDIINIQKKIIPEAFATFEKRYDILRNIYILQPIGRRALANRLSIGERIVRGEMEFLKEQGLIDVNPAGMMITHEGLVLMDQLKEIIYHLRGISGLQEQLKKKLQINSVYIVPGNIENDKYVLRDLSKTTSRILEGSLVENSIVGVTGGSTMAEVANEMTQQSKKRGIVVVPARGGLGKKVESQANTIAAVMANKLNGSYQLLHASDTMSQEAIESILQDPEIKKITDLIKQVNILVFGIGRSDKMAERRELSQEIIELLQSRRAVAEAFGHYFNRDGEIVHEMKTVGINLEDFCKVPTTIGVAGGPKKAEAIVAISKIKKDLILVTDEGATREILEKY